MISCTLKKPFSTPIFEVKSNINRLSLLCKIVSYKRSVVKWRIKGEKKRREKKKERAKNGDQKRLYLEACLHIRAHVFLCTEVTFSIKQS